MQIGGVGGSTSNTQSVISFDKANQIFPGYGSPTQIWNSLTGLFGKGPTTPDTYKAARGKSVVDLVRDDLSALQRVNMSASDKKKLSDWVDLLNQTGGTVGAQCTMDTATKIGLTAEAVQKAAGGGLNADLSVITPVMMNLAVLTSICDSNRVIFVKCPATMFSENLGLTVDVPWSVPPHWKCQHGRSMPLRRDGDDSQIDGFYAQQFAFLVKQLDSIVEGDKTLLDNTATVGCRKCRMATATISTIYRSSRREAAGYFKVGQAINVEAGKTDLTVGHSEEECKNGQSPIGSF